MVTKMQRSYLGYILSGLLLVSTSGIPMHKLVCLCKGEQTIQFYAEPEGCCSTSSGAVAAGCCSSQACQAESTCFTTGHACQDKEVSILKIVDQFLDSGPAGTKSIVFAVLPAQYMFRQVDLAMVGNLPGQVRSQRYKHIQPTSPIYRMSCQMRC